MSGEAQGRHFHITNIYAQKQLNGAYVSLIYY